MHEMSTVGIKIIVLQELGKDASIERMQEVYEWMIAEAIMEEEPDGSVSHLHPVN